MTQNAHTHQSIKIEKGRRKMINIEKVLFFSNRDHVNAPRVGQT